MASPPRRLVHVDEARRRFGPAIDRLSALMTEGDPLADDLLEASTSLPPGTLTRMVDQALASGIDSVSGAPPELRALFAALDHVPAWVDRDALARGGELLLRAGWFGGLALATSLLYGYASPGGNKPLVFSGRLYEQAPRRLIETSRFVQATCSPNGLLRDKEGFAITVRVRMMHAHVRRMIVRTGRWSSADWGLPANQHDMGGTALLFSVVVIETLTRLGFDFDEEEVHLFMQLWRYSGYLMGVHAEVLPTSYREGRRLADMIASTELGPDDDSRELSRALFASGEKPARASEQERRRALRVVKIGQGLIRGALGDELADQLAVPRHRYRHVFPAARAVVRGIEQAAKAAPGFARASVRRRSVRLGQEYWDMLVRSASTPLTFAPPDRLLGKDLDGAVAQAVADGGGGPRRTLASFARPR
jgi:hypothetical protein